MLNSINHQENAIQGHNELPFSSAGMAKLLDNRKYWQEYRELELSDISDGSVKQYKHFRNTI